MTFDRPVACPIYNAEEHDCGNLAPCADIIITDYKMPQMTGIEMLLQQEQKQCRIDRRNKALLSADPYKVSRKMIDELGCAFFAKPYDFNELFEWLDACERRVDLSKPVAIKRKERRYPADTDIVYECNNAEKICKGTTVNYSDRGLCFIADTSLQEKQSVVIKNELPNGCKNASVIWVKPLGPGSYVTGLMAQ